MLDDEGESGVPPARVPSVSSPSELTRIRLGRELQALYEPVLDESLDPRLAELMRQLEADMRA